MILLATAATLGMAALGVPAPNPASAAGNAVVSTSTGTEQIGTLAARAHHHKKHHHKKKRHHKPTAKLTIAFTFASTQVNAGGRPTINLTAAGVPNNAKVLLQRQMGTANTYAKIAHLNAHTGRVAAPAVPQGRYGYRIQVVQGTGHNKKVLATTASRTLYSYATVSMRQLCERSKNTDFSTGCDNETTQVGGSVFAYATAGGDGNSGPTDDGFITAQSSSCRSATIAYAESNDESAGVTTVGIALSQENADLQQATGPIGKINQATFTIKSSNWDMTRWTDGGQNVFVNGAFSCWSPTGDAS